MTTPFIDSLTPSQREIVALKSKGEDRPTYFNSDLQERIDQTALVTSLSTAPADTAEVQISEDLEAALILMQPDMKTRLLTFINTALSIASTQDPDDFAMLSEVVEVRATGYQQINMDVGRQVLSYDRVREEILQFIETTGRQGGNPKAGSPTAVLVSDLSVLFASLSDSYDGISVPDILAVHDRIADAAMLYAVQGAANNRARELSSWVGVITTYLAS